MRISSMCYELSISQMTSVINIVNFMIMSSGIRSELHYMGINT